MKRLAAFMFCLVLVAVAVNAMADPARFYNDDKNQSYHSEHLRLHLGSINCKVSGNYIKVRSQAGGKKIVGHLEMADTFTLDEISDHWAKITVTRASKYSTDSHVGLTGWVDADYVECPCSSEEYYANTPRLTYSLAVTTQKTTHVREHPSKTTSSFSQLKKDEQVEVISEYTGKDGKVWYRVRSTKGVMGYIRSDLLQITATGLVEPGLAAQAVVTAEPTAYVEPITAAPVTEIPVTAAPITEVPVTEIPVTEAPITEAPATEEPQNIMMITPDQSLPSSEEVAGNTAGRTTGDGDEGLNSLTLQSEDMWIAIVNVPKYICLTIEPETDSASPIQLIQWDTETTIGVMVDDGTNGDEIADDGVYSLGFTVSGDDWGKAQYIAAQGDLWSNDVIVHFYNPDRELNGHYVTELQEAQAKIETQSDDVFSELVKFVKDQYLQGNVSEYTIDDESIRYCESRTSYVLTYELPVKKITEARAIAAEEPPAEQELESWQQSIQDLLYGDGEVPNTPMPTQEKIEYTEADPEMDLNSVEELGVDIYSLTGAVHSGGAIKFRAVLGGTPPYQIHYSFLEEGFYYDPNYIGSIDVTYGDSELYSTFWESHEWEITYTPHNPSMHVTITLEAVDINGLATDPEGRSLTVYSTYNSSPSVVSQSN